MEITKIKMHCMCCEMTYVIAYRERKNTPEVCPFCGEDVVVPEDDEELLNEDCGD